MKVRKMKKNYKANLMRIAEKLPAILPTKCDRRRFVSMVTAKWAREMRRRKHETD